MADLLHRRVPRSRKPRLLPTQTQRRQTPQRGRHLPRTTTLQRHLQHAQEPTPLPAHAPRSLNRQPPPEGRSMPQKRHAIKPIRLDKPIGTPHPDKSSPVTLYNNATIMQLFSLGHAFVKQDRIESIERPDDRDAYRTKSNDCADAGPDVALLAAIVRMTQRQVEPVVGLEVVEHLSVAHPPECRHLPTSAASSNTIRGLASPTRADSFQGQIDTFGVLSRYQEHSRSVQIRKTRS